ncbi:MAG: CusA/CzcA family heavy metal efflux RND transporter [bacterium]|nr:CusA/CzcA family heavy metal efflux RND transporter [bacterium]
MIEQIIRWCVKNWAMVLVMSLGMGLWGLKSLHEVPLDAIPDLSDVQVIVYTDWPGQSPDLVEDQVTYPIVTSLLGAPKVRYVRGQSFFGLSFVNVIFEEGTDLYWARSRVVEYLSGIAQKIPPGVSPELGPDATGVGWVYQYALRDRSGKRSLADLRSLQDWVLAFELKSVPGVAEVASVGGFVKQYQVQLDPNRLRAYDISIEQVVNAVRKSNLDVGGRVLEISGAEHFIRGRGYIQSPEDLELVPVAEFQGTPVFVRQLGHVTIGSEMRRGAADLDGEGETVGGIVVMRWGGNAKEVIDRVKLRLKELQRALPEGVEIVPVYDRSILINEAVDHLINKLSEEVIFVALVVSIFLWNIRGSVIAIIPLPLAVLISFIPFGYSGLTANIMSLSGIAIAIGAMVDASIILVENAHKHLERWEDEGRPGPRTEVIAKAMAEMGRPLFFALLVITVSFMPIFALTGQEGKLFKPLAWTKTFSMAAAAILAITLTPALAVLLMRGKALPEEKHPISRALIAFYAPLVRWVLKRPKRVLILALLGVVSIWPLATHLGSEFMPPLNEGTLLYMPTAVPGISIGEAVDIAHRVGREIKEVPEVDHVFTKIGRSESATDPAPLSMIEAVVSFKPKSQWRQGYDLDKLTQELDRKVQIPGMPNIWWMPIQTRTEMLATGIRSAVGIKVLGADLAQVEAVGKAIEKTLEDLPGTRSAFAERSTGGHFIDFEIDRQKAARYGLSAEKILTSLAVAVGGKNVSIAVEGRERYPIQVRYARDFRSSIEELEKILIPTPKGAHIPIAQLAKIFVRTGPPMIRDENGRLASFVFVDIDQNKTNLGDYVAAAKERIANEVPLPVGVSLAWAGQYEHLQRAAKTLATLVPLTLALVVLLIYLNTRSVAETVIVLMAVPFSLIGAFGLLWVLDYHLSVAVWVGIIALAGLDAETGVVMLLYLKLSHRRWAAEGRLKTPQDFVEALVEGAAGRIRPKLMTAASTWLGLLPILWSTGAGAGIMKRIAAPMVGGIATSVVLELLVYPVIYSIWRGRNFTVAPSTQEEA